MSFDTVRQGVEYGAGQRQYTLQSGSSLGTVTWEDIPGYSGIRAEGDTVTYTNSTPGPAGFYRGRTRYVTK